MLLAHSNFEPAQLLPPRSQFLSLSIPVASLEGMLSFLENIFQRPPLVQRADFFVFSLGHVEICFFRSLTPKSSSTPFVSLQLSCEDLDALSTYLLKESIPHERLDRNRLRVIGPEDFCLNYFATSSTGPGNIISRYAPH